MTAYDTLSSVATRQLDRIRGLEAEVAQFRTEPWIKLRAERDALNEQVVRLAKEYETQVALAGQRATERDALRARLDGLRAVAVDRGSKLVARVAECAREFYDCYNGPTDNRTAKMDALYRKWGGGRDSGETVDSGHTAGKTSVPIAAANSVAHCCVKTRGGEYWSVQSERDDVRECEG